MLIQALLSFGIFLNSFLLFILQLYVGKLILPIFGGTAAVWSAVLLFFQASLLIGYSVCYGATRRLKYEKACMAIYCCVIVGACLYGFRSTTPVSESLVSLSPLRALLTTLTKAFLLPAIVLSSGSTLYQRCASRMGSRFQGDPYKLYSLSNIGSFLALACYPLWIELAFPLDVQGALLQFGFYLNATILVACISAVFLSLSEKALDEAQLQSSFTYQWITIPACTSGLLIAVTMYICANVAPIPLLWAVPLFLFLLSYTIGFSKISEILEPNIALMLRLAVIILLYCWCIDFTDPLGLSVGIYLFLFFTICVALHTTLFLIKPASSQLPHYYLCIALGGLVGGSIVNFLAPVLFSDMYELPLLIATALCVVAPRLQLGERKLLFVVASALCALAIVYVSSKEGSYYYLMCLWITLLAVAYVSDPRPSSLGPRVFLIAVFAALMSDIRSDSVFAGRNFYGALKVVDRDSFRILIHGVTYHGEQKIAARGSCNPASYYYPTGPAGFVLTAAQGALPNAKVGLVGVGTGALLCYLTPTQHVSLFDINPLVLEIASDQRYFTYLSQARGVVEKTHLGDARTSLRSVPSNSYDILVIDAFNSDAIPVHFLTVEALQEFRRVLTPDGVLLLHLSNKYLELAPVVAAGADTVRLDSFFWDDGHLSAIEKEGGKSGSLWALLGNPSPFQTLVLQQGLWHRINAKPRDAWTDQYSNLWQRLQLK